MKHLAIILAIVGAIVVGAVGPPGTPAFATYSISVACTSPTTVAGTVTFPAGTLTFSVFLTDHKPGEPSFTPVPGAVQVISPTLSQTSATYILPTINVRPGSNTIRVESTAFNEKSASIPPCYSPPTTTPTKTATPGLTATATATRTNTPSPTATGTLPPTSTATVTPTGTLPPTQTATSTATSTPTATGTPTTTTFSGCDGNGNFQVVVNGIVTFSQPDPRCQNARCENGLLITRNQNGIVIAAVSAPQCRFIPPPPPPPPIIIPPAPPAIVVQPPAPQVIVQQAAPVIVQAPAPAPVIRPAALGDGGLLNSNGNLRADGKMLVGVVIAIGLLFGLAIWTHPRSSR